MEHPWSRPDATSGDRRQIGEAAEWLNQAEFIARDRD